MSNLLSRVKADQAAQQLRATLGSKFEATQTTVAGTIVAANLVAVGGQQYRSVGITGAAGSTVSVRNVGTPAAAVFGPSSGGGGVLSSSSGSSESSGGTDHAAVTLATPAGLQFADQPTQVGLSIADSLAGNGLIIAGKVLAVGAGNLIAVNADDVALANGSAQYQVPVTGANPYTPSWTALSTFAGAGLVFSGGVFAVGAGNGITVNADDVALTTPGSLSATSTNSASGSHTHAIDATIARAAVNLTAGAGLTGGGDLSANRTFNVGAGTLITVNADDVALANGSAQYQVPVTGANPYTPSWTALSTFAGAGLVFSGGVFAVGAGNGITVNADDVALTTPGTLTVATTNSASGSHTHAITSSSSPGAAASLLASDATGMLTLVNLAVSNAMLVTGTPRRYYEVAQYNSSGNSEIGTLKITLPKLGSATMMRIQIIGYQFSATYGRYAWECIVGGYNPNATTFAYSSVETRGEPPFTQVRLADDGVSNCILLGDLTTRWYYPKIVVQHMIAGHNNTTGWETGWSMAVIDDETGITIRSTPTIYHAPPDYRTITAGNGMEGGGDLTANRTITLGTPAALTVATTNGVSSTSHTHAITSSSNPGAAAILLASSASGYLQIVRLGVGIAPTVPLHVSGNGKFTGSVDVDVQFLGQAADTVTAPSYSWTGDTNTGMYRPATDSIAMTTAGVERMRIDAGGNVGIATSAIQSWNTTYRATQFGNNAALMYGSSAAGLNVFLLRNSYYDGAWKYQADGPASALALTTTGAELRVAASGTEGGGLTWTTPVYLTLAGNLGLGASPNASYRLDVTGDARLTGDLYVDGGRVDFGTNYLDEDGSYLQLYGAKNFKLNQMIWSTGWEITTAGAGTFTDVITPSVRAATGAALTIGAGTDVIIDPTSTIARMGSGVAIQASSYASQTTGWRVTDAGEGDFRYIFTDELHAKSFIADLEQALAGGQIISKSVAVVATDFTLPAAGAYATLRVRDLPSAPNMAVFQSGDFVGLRQFDRSAGSLTIGWAWGVVTLYADGTSTNEGTQTWRFTRSATTPGAATGTIPAEAIALDFGTTGNGFYEVNAIDGAYGANSPYAQVVTWVTHPATQTVRARFGHLRGIFNVANEFGLYAGSGTGTADRYIRASSTAVELRNVPLALYAGANNTMLLSAGVDNDAPFLAMGSTLPTGPLVQNGLWMGKDGSDYEFRVGTVSAGALVAGMHWDGSLLTVAGHVIATTGLIGGWSIGATTLSATNITLTSGAANTANITAGTGSTAGGINSAAAGGDIVFWAGSTYASRASAVFRVTAAGAVTATSGVIGGWTLAATSLTAGSGSTRVGLDSGGTNPAFYAGSATPGAAPFRVTAAGALTATSGVIGGWTLSATSLTAGSGATTVGLDNGGTNPAFYAGSATPGSAPFRVTAAGVLTATSGTVGGWTMAATTLSATNITLTNGAANTANITAGTGSTAGGINSAAAGADIVFWAGDTHANRATALFKVTAAGALTATSGVIGGWTLSATSLTAGSGATTVGLDNGGTNPAFYAGSATPGAAPFRVTAAGVLTATSGTVGGWTMAATTLSATNITLTNGAANTANITAGTGSTAGGINSAAAGGDIVFWAGSTHANRATAVFRVTAAGALTATSGVIGGWTLAATSLKSGSGSTTVGLDSGGTNPAFYAGNATPGVAPFRVTSAGVLTATSGTVGGWTMAATTLSATNITLTSGAANTANITAGTGATAGGINSAAAGGDIVFWAGSTYANRAAAVFRVTAAGALTATGASITGSLSAAGGAIIANDDGLTLNVALSNHALRFYDAGTLLGKIEGFSDLDRHLHMWVAYSVKGSDLTLGVINGVARASGYLTSIQMTQTGMSLVAPGTVEITAGAITAGGNTVWHAGNDGAGTGLHADLLDGYHASSFALSGHTHSGVYAPLSHTHSYMDITGNGNITTTGTLSAKADTAASIHALGYARIGHPTASNAMFAHKDHFTNSNYALAQLSDGYTLINCEATKYVGFRNGDTEVAYIKSDQFYLNGFMRLQEIATAPASGDLGTATQAAIFAKNDKLYVVFKRSDGGMRYYSLDLTQTPSGGAAVNWIYAGTSA
jgi:hypothetical protein